jgi:phosphatidylglycerophosphatase A
MTGVALWIAQGFSVGRIPWMPGTFGSALGLLWVAALLSTGSAWAYFAGTVAGLLGSVCLCGKAERILNQTDPGSVVLDEIVAMPICCAGWLFGMGAHSHSLPPPASLYAHGGWVWTAGIFLAFRFFDIVKPWPVRQSQRLPGGWGVTVDDALAAGYVNLVVAAVGGVRAWFDHG